MARAASPASPPADSRAKAEQLASTYRELREQIARRIVGQDQVLEEILIALFSGGHCLLIGVPGLAKTLIVRTLSELLDLRFGRIQFTPDLMPSDITGTEVMFQEAGGGARYFKFVPGPIFAQVILADEINRTPPKTQAALMEAMEERQVTSHGQRHPLPDPFIVLATQNPIEQEGTYPLPAAQLDRFMFSVVLDYPGIEDEYKIVKLTTGSRHLELPRLLDRERILDLQRLVNEVEIPREVMRYAVTICRKTRVGRTRTPEWIKHWVSWGVGPRGPYFLLRGGRARALLQGRMSVSAADIRAVALPVLRHRLLVTYHAEAEGMSPDMIVSRLVGETESPDGWKPLVKAHTEGQGLLGRFKHWLETGT